MFGEIGFEPPTSYVVLARSPRRAHEPVHPLTSAMPTVSSVALGHDSETGRRQTVMFSFRRRLLHKI